MPKQCGYCGKKPPDGFASIYDGSGTVWLCHPDDLSAPDCYELYSLRLSSRAQTLTAIHEVFGTRHD